MNIVGSCEIPLVFMPEHRVRRMTVRVSEGLPYGLITGAAFLRQHGSVLNFAEGGGDFNPSPEPPWVPLRSIAECSTPSKKQQRAGKRHAHEEPGNPGSNTWNRGDTVGVHAFAQWHRRRQRKSRKG